MTRFQQNKKDALLLNSLILTVYPLTPTVSPV